MKVSAWTTKRVKAIWESLWFVPVMIAALGIAIGLFMPWLDLRLFGDAGPEAGTLLERLVPGTASADSLLSAMLTGLTTILGVAFSVTVVTLQLAATQYTSRLLRRFMADPLTQSVLGIYIASIVYLAMVLRALDPGTQGTVPALSLLFGLLAFLACIVLLAVFIHHLAHSIQAGTVVTSIARDTNHVVRRKLRGQSVTGQPEVPDEQPCQITSRGPGYLQLVNEEELLHELPDGCTVARVEARTGQFLLAGRPLVSLWPAVQLEERTEARVRRAFALAGERTTHQDALYGVRQLVDVALKALSPAVNDMHTGVMVVNELGTICDNFLQTVEGPGVPWRLAQREGVRLYLPQLDLQLLLTHAFDELPRAATQHPVVIARLLEVLAELSEKFPHPGVRARLLGTGNRVSEFLELETYAPSEQSLLREKQEALLRARASQEPDLANPI